MTEDLFQNKETRDTMEDNICLWIRFFTGEIGKIWVGSLGKKKRKYIYIYFLYTIFENFKFETCRVKNIFKNPTTFYVTLGKSLNFPEFVFCCIRLGK